jgi:hypothetical protein
MAVELKAQGDLIMRILRRTLMIFGDGGFKDETIGYNGGFQQPRNRMDFGNRTRGQFD